MGTGQISGPNSVLDKTFKVASGVTITGYQAVMLASKGGEIQLTSATSSLAIGVAQVNPGEGISYTAGRNVPVRLLGISKAVANAVIVSGARVTPTGAYGMVATATTGNFQVGLALESAWAHGQLIDVLLTPGMVSP